jgi:biotin synthase-related radical SAM superfamily protein
MSFISTLKKFFLTVQSQPAIMAISTDGENTMTKEVTKNYTEAQEAEMIALGSIDNVVAMQLAEKFGKNVASIRAKAVRLGVYQAKERVSKSGAAIERKEAIVAEIASLVGKNMEGLEKAPKQALVAIRAALSA